MSASDIKSWDLMWSAHRMLAVWIDPMSGKRIEAPVYITPEGKFRVQMPAIDLEDIR